MKVIWQCIEATIIPILTYGWESWDPTKKEEEQIQKMFNTALEMTMSLPQGTPTTVLLKKTGFITVKHEINLKRIMQARRVEEKTGRSIIKDIMTENSIWMKKTMEIMEQYHLQWWHLKLKKDALKKIVKQITQEKWEEEIRTIQEKKSKIKHWSKLTLTTSIRRLWYTEKLTRKESKAILRARASMMNVRTNHKNGQENHKCRFYNETEETQEHVIQD